MNIFILEDDNYKYKELEKFLLEKYENRINITREKALNSARKFVRDTDIKFDLFIVDMQVPRFEDKMFDIVTDAGRSFMYTLERYLDSYNAFIFSSKEPSKNEELEWVTYNSRSCDWGDNIVKIIDRLGNIV